MASVAGGQFEVDVDERASAAEGQLKVLRALDMAKTQWYHFTTIIIAGMGFFTDAYDLFCISTVTKLLGRIYYTNSDGLNPGSLPPHVSAAVNGVALCGTLAGQLFFGCLGDKLGRKKVYGVTLILTVICSIASGLSFGHSAKSVMATLCFFRFWLGFGIGGDYLLSAAIMAKYIHARTRGRFVAAVCAMQGTGILAGAAVPLIISAAFNNHYARPPFEIAKLDSTPPEADYIWRLVFMFGAIPALLTYYWRMRMPEMARYTALVEGNAKKAAEDMTTVLADVRGASVAQQRVDLMRRSQDSTCLRGLFTRQFARRHGLHLLGAASTWFLLDIAFYSQNLFQKDIFTAIGWLPAAKKMSALEEVFKISRAQALIALCSTVLGYWFTVAFIEIMGRFWIQLIGFFMMTAFMFGLAIPYEALKNGHHMTFVVLYAFTFFFANFGPNSTIFIVPEEIFPARFRSTCHGISAASGNAGAIIGAFGFLYAAQSPIEGKQDAGYPTGVGVSTSLLILGGINALGFLFTFLVPEIRHVIICYSEVEDIAAAAGR